MNPDQRKPDESLPLAAHERIDRACVAFEAAWQTGQRPKIEEHLGDAAGAERAALLRELLLLELDYRRRAGERPVVDEYRQRFPTDATVIDAAFVVSGMTAAALGAGLSTPPKSPTAGLPSGPETVDQPSGSVGDRPQRGRSGSVGDRPQRGVGQPRGESASSMAAIVSAADRDGERGVRFKCPHCGHRIQLVEPQPHDVVCRNCGSSIQIDPSATVTHRPGTLPKKIGKFEVLEQLGRGAFGAVYKARDPELDHVVAIKVPRAGYFGSHEEEERFLREARSAARLKHAAIVQVHAIEHDAGVPFIVSEFIDGLTLADVLSAGRPAFRESAELLAEIADALDYAHRERVIHRDLKPANILIDHAGRPHVTDFGLARRDEGEITVTVEGQILGTPAYMSPEQAAGEQTRVDARSDVYSLGVILYELLSGELPFRGNVRMLLHQVQHDEPRAPRSLNDTIPLDLDTICLKAISKEPARRYPTARALADELRRWLAGEPIQARPVGQAERLWRWARRNPRIAMLTGTVAMLLVAVAIASSIMAIMADRHRQFAEQAASTERDLRNDADQKRIDAEKARDETTQVLDYVVAAFRKSDPDADGEKLTVAELLGQAVEQLETTFPNQPLIQAQLLNAIGQTYDGLGLYQKSIDVYERARNLRRNELGEDHEDTLSSMNNLGLAYKSAGRLAEALPQLEQTLELCKTKLGPEHPGTLTAMNNLANAYESTGRLTEALPLYAQTLELMKAKVGPEHPDTLKSMNNLAHAYGSAGKLAEALPLLEQALESSREHLGRDHSSTLTLMENLGAAYKDAGRLDEAVPLLEKALELGKPKLGPEHPSTLAFMNNLTVAYESAGRLADAFSLYKQALELSKDKLGQEHAHTLKSMSNLASAYASAGKQAEAFSFFEQTLELMKAKLGLEHPDTLATMNNLARGYWLQKRLDRSIPLFQETLSLVQANLGADHPHTLMTMFNLAVNYRDAGRTDEAVRLFEETLTLQEAKVGARHPFTLICMRALATAYLVNGQPDKALAKFDQFIAGQRGQALPNETNIAGLLAEMSAELLEHRQYAAAETYLRECLTIREKKLPDDPLLFKTKSMLGGALAGQKKFAEAEPLLVAGYAGMKEREAKIPPPAKTRLAEAIHRLVDLYTAWEKPEESAKWQALLEESRQEGKDQ